MNDKIKEPYYSLMYKASIGWNEHLFQVPPELLEKYSELIVQECIGDFEDKIRRRYAGDEKSINVGYGMELVIDSIKQKFGVL